MATPTAQLDGPGTDKKKRASRPKVKTGCITCKYRHVKCDETKPFCIKCCSTGRKCDGYAEPKVPKSKLRRAKSDEVALQLVPKRENTPERQLKLHHGTVKERRALEFFFHRTAPQLSGFFSRAFWNGCVLQISLNEPAIRYAMVAVSAMYENEEAPGSSPVAGTDQYSAFALQSYNKAIGSLVAVVQSKPESIRVPVMAAIIFVCLEFLRGHVHAALTHIESGIRMLKAWREKEFKDMIKLPAESAFIEEELVPMFGWLNLLSSLFGRPSLDLYSFRSVSGEDYHFSPHEPAKNIEQAKTMLLDLVNVAVKFIQSIGEAKYTGEVTIEMMSEQIRIQTFMTDWRNNFEQLRREEKATHNDQIKVGCCLLEAVAKTIDVWLAAALFPNETAWDAYKSDFEDLVRLSGVLVASSVRFPDELSKRFSFEMGIIPPLHFVAWKCRWPHIRRRALALLWACPRRECLFESHRSFTCFTRAMQVEEEGLGLSPGQIPGPDDLPPEAARIHQVDISSSPPTPEGHPLSFLLKPEGLTGPWYARTEYVNLGKVELGDTLPALSDTELHLDAQNLGGSNGTERRPGNMSRADYSYTGLPINNSESINTIGEWRGRGLFEAGLNARNTAFQAHPLTSPDRASESANGYFDAYSVADSPAYFSDTQITPPILPTTSDGFHIPATTAPLAAAPLAYRTCGDVDYLH